MLIGIDIGGTKTHIVVSEDAAEDAHLIVPTSTWQHNGLFGDRTNAERLMRLIPADMADPSKVAVAVGAHGCDSNEQCDRFRRLLESHHPGPVTVVNDAQLLGPAAGLQDAISVIVGTGSIVVGQNRAGAVISVGGHGWLLGDPGSAPALARESVRGVLASRDAGELLDILGQMLMKEYRICDEKQLMYAFTHKPSITSWGKVAPLVFQAALSGSIIAQAVIDSAAHELAANTVQAKNRGAIGHDVLVAGGVITNQRLLFDAFRRHLEELAPELRVRLLSRPPVHGALAMAKQIIQTSSNPGGKDEVEQQVI